MIEIRDLKIHFGEQEVLRGIDWFITPKSRIGLVGDNGAGKTTLLRALTGAADYEGTISMPKGHAVGYLPQDLVEIKEMPLMDYLKESAGLSELSRQLADCERSMSGAEAAGGGLRALLSQHERLQRSFEAKGGFEFEIEAKRVLHGLGFAPERDASRVTSEFSGGWKMRVAMAALLLSRSDIMLLDEPTNHLDSETIAWLEEYLAGRKGALLMVTHDRNFLDHTATRILELDKGHSYTYAGNYSAFLEQKAERLARAQASEEKRQNFLRNELKWLRRGAQARSTKQKARIARYEAVASETPDLSRDTVEIGLKGSRLGRTVIELDHVSYEAGGRTIVRDFSYTVLRRDRVAILGRNGTGKTTLLDLIAGRRQPTRGTVTIGQTVKIGYFTQRAVEMDERLRAIEYIEEAAHAITLADGSRISASQLMERFLFPGSLQWTPIARLSGGEKRRLYLLRILMEAPNVLLLDEPTNDLDLETMAVLEQFIDEFDGAILFVSHDRFFVDRLADKVFAYEPDGRLRMYAGGYTYYQERRAEELAPAAAARPAPAADKADKAKGAPAARPRPAAAPKLTFREQKEYEEIEDVIASKEGELKVVRLQMEQSAADYGRLAELSREEQRLSAELDHLMERWTYLEGIAEAQQG